MAKNEITGRLVYIGQTEELPSRSGGNVFRKREFLLDATTYDLYTGERSQYENILALEMTGDRCADLDKFSVGTAVTVSFALQGREWTNRDGEVRRMTSVRCYGIEARQNRMQGANAGTYDRPGGSALQAPVQPDYTPRGNYDDEPDGLPF